MADGSIAFGTLPGVVEIAAGADLAEPAQRAEALAALESGQVVFLPNRVFELTDVECERMLDGTAMEAALRECTRLRGRPTILFDTQTRTIEPSVLPPAERGIVEAMLGRYAEWCRELVAALLPGYAAAAFQERVTFRPGLRTHAQGLHVDSAKLHPTHGRSLLRVFCNIDPRERPRVWEVGEAFEPMARRLLPPPVLPPLRRRLAARLGLGKPLRTAYDLRMEELHHAVKFDADYQRAAPRKLIEFPSGSTWLAMPDVLVHGAVYGQYSLDQVFFLPVAAMSEPERSSLRILERLGGRRLV